MSYLIDSPGPIDRRGTATEPLPVVQHDRPRVLVVDDDVVASRALRTILERAGFATVLCNEGIHAMSEAARIRPSAVLLDIHLRDINGLVLGQSLRRQFGTELHIFILSGDTSMETINSLPLVGATYFFSKPITPAVIVEHLRRCLGDAEPERPAGG